MTLTLAATASNAQSYNGAMVSHYTDHVMVDQHYWSMRNSIDNEIEAMDREYNREMEKADREMRQAMEYGGGNGNEYDKPGTVMCRVLSLEVQRLTHVCGH